MSAGHTDGPWVANDNHSGSTVWRIETDAPGHPNDGWIIAELCGPDAQANARLIAAAPELLEALTEMLRLSVIGADDAEVLNAANSQARAALARARGETPKGEK